MVKQHIAISGLANTGKDTLSRTIQELLQESGLILTFADPIKKIAEQMFPTIPNKYLYGPSEYRNEKITPYIFQDGKILTVRQLLLDIGTRGREYQEDIWINNFDFRFMKENAFSSNRIICSDERFRNEHDYLKSKGFFQIRLYRRSSSPTLNHESENKQSEIKDEEFDYVLHNDGSLVELQQEVLKQIIPRLKDR